MSYHYSTQRPFLFTEAGMKMVLEMRDKIAACLDKSGAFMSGHVFVTGDCWNMLAVLDYLVERGELKEIQRECAGQHRVFISAKGT